MRLYKCCFHASIIFVMGCPSSCTRPLALEFPSRHDSLLPFLPSSKVKRFSLSLRAWMIFSGALSHCRCLVLQDQGHLPFHIPHVTLSALARSLLPTSRGKNPESCFAKGKELQENAGWRGILGKKQILVKFDHRLIESFRF